MAEVNAGGKLVRFAAGLVGVAGLAIGLFTLLLPMIHR